MARKKNSTFAGGSVTDVDVGSATFKRLVADAVGDTALIFDKATGENSEAGVITHNGGTGTGALLGMPIINQWVGRSLQLTSHDTAGKNGGVGDFVFFPAVFHLAAGETELRVEVCMDIGGHDDVFQPYARVCDTANAEVTRVGLTPIAAIGEPALVYTGRLTGLTAGFNILYIGIDTTNVDTVVGGANIGKLHYVRARPRLPSALAHAPGSHGEGGAASAPIPADGDLYGVTVPAATEGVAHTNFDSTMLANLSAIDGYTLSRLNRNLNGLLEYITGLPAGGPNATYVHEDQDGAAAADSTNPARSRFEAHTRSLYPASGGTHTGEGELDFPMWCESFGAFIYGTTVYFAVDLAEPPTKGSLDCYAPWPIDAVGGVEITIRQIFMKVPDFQSTSSRLKCAVLFASTDAVTADPTQWTIKCKTTTGNATAVPADTDGRNDVWLAQISAVPFTGDSNELVEIRMTRTGAKPAGTAGIGEIAVLSACLAFDP